MSISDTKKILQQIGLSEVAVQIYLYLLDAQKATPLTIAQGTEIRRTTVYNHLIELLEINLIGEVIDKGKKYYIPESPEYLLDYVEEKRKKAEQLAQEIEKQFGTKKHKATIRYAYGREGFKKFAEEILDAQENIVKMYLHYSSVQEYVSDQYIVNFLDRHKQSKKELHVIVSSNEHEELAKATTIGGNAQYNMLIRSLPKGYDFTTTIVVYDNKVHFFAPKKEGFIFIFESFAFADTMKQMFDYMWKKSTNIN